MTHVKRFDRDAQVDLKCAVRRHQYVYETICGTLSAEECYAPVSRIHLRSVCLFASAAYLLAAATPPDFSGNWVLDPSRSQNTNGETIQLTIQEPPGKMVYDRVLRKRNGKELHTKFTCASLSTPCDVEENGHKAKVSLWFDGAALMMAKTGGEKQDATTERRFELSPDGKMLTVEFTNYSGSGKPQKLVFNKQ